ncbi:MAG TPA: hypothetical protein VLT82_00785 [Myxococcaceae bacterium]|nr:hypothetical protein [Myxococcaceae bacterium]
MQLVGTTPRILAVLGLFACGTPVPAPTATPWRSVASMHEARFFHTATMLSDGRVLVTGGILTLPVSDVPVLDALPSAELYDPASNSWKLLPEMTTPRNLHQAFLLRDGRVLVGGGCRGLEFTQRHGTWIIGIPERTAEIYDPRTNSWSSAGTFTHPPGAITLLPDGRVLAAGSAENAMGPFGTESELLDPTTRLTESTGSMPAGAWLEDLVPLPSGEILSVGGYRAVGSGADINLTTQLYQPSSGTWREVGKFPVPRVWSAVAGLPGGDVLRAGGCVNQVPVCTQEPVPLAWRYHHEEEVWEPTTSMLHPRLAASPVAIGGKVMLAGGNDVWRPTDGGTADYYRAPEAEIFDPEHETWASAGLMPHYLLGGAAAVVLPSGEVLLTGGFIEYPAGFFKAINAAQRWTPPASQP